MVSGFGDHTGLESEGLQDGRATGRLQGMLSVELLK